MATKELEPLFSELDGFIQEGAYEEALECCDKILKIAPADFDALACRCLCLIHLSEFQEVVDQIHTSSFGKQLSFERAYALYRLKRYSESLEVLRGSNAQGEREKELEAQLLYALEDYDGCVRIYEGLLNDHKVDSPELRTNLCAALCQSNPNKGLQYISDNKKALNGTFEFAYNAACTSIAIRDFKSAEELLELSKRICRESLKECTEEEIEDEIVPILVQLGYVHQLCGKIDQAMELYTSAVKSNTSNAAAAAVASNNIVTIKKEHDLFDSEKKLKRAMGEKVQDKLTKVQKKAIAFNYCLLLLCMNKVDQCREQAGVLRKQYPDSALPSLFLAALELRTKKLANCENILKEEIVHLKEEDKVRAQLSLAQLYLSQHEMEKATEVLLSLTSLRHRPALLSLLVSLYERQADIHAAVSLLDTAEAALEEADVVLRKAVLRASGSFKLKHGLYREAAAVYRKLVKLDRGDIESLSRLAIACAEFDPMESESYVERMPSSKNETVLDGEALESAAMPTLHRRDKDTPAEHDSTAQVERKNKDKQKKKKKKIRYPKNYDPALNTLPDPERWLPKRERSYYKRRGKKNMIGRGPQGAAAAPELERTPVDTEKGAKAEANRGKAMPGQKQAKPPAGRGKRRGKK